MGRQRSGEPVPSFDPSALRRARVDARLSHDALGALVRMPRPALIYYEQGRTRPGVDVLAALARTLGVDPFELMGVHPDEATLPELRARAGLTKTALAGHLGVARSTWALVERGTRTLQPAVAELLGDRLGLNLDEVHAAYQRGLQARGSGVASPVTQARHFALRHHLGEPVAGDKADEAWLMQRVQDYAFAAGLRVHRTITDRDEFTALTGVAVGPRDWGKASWADGYHVVFVDPQCGDGTKASVELIIAHEVAHLRWRSYGHRQVFFDRVQDLIDTLRALTDADQLPGADR